MNTLITMTLDEVKKNPLTEEEKNVIRRAAAQVRAGTAEDDPDCPKQTKEELAKFRPWYEVHPEWREAKKTEIHLQIDTDVLEWYKSQGRGYQTKMNDVLRAHAFLQRSAEH